MDLKSNIISKGEIDFTKSLSSVGAVVGIGYSIIKNKSLGGTLFYVFGFALAGAALGRGIDILKQSK